MNRTKVAAAIAMVGIIGSSVAGCSEKTHPLNERIFADVICMKVYTAGGSGSNCRTVLKASTSELEACIPKKPSSPISSLQELSRYCPSVAARITSNTGSTAPNSAQGTDTDIGFENGTEAAPEPENVSDLGNTVKAVALGIIGLVAVTAFGFWYRHHRDQKNRTAQRAHAAEHGWHI